MKGMVWMRSQTQGYQCNTTLAADDRNGVDEVTNTGLSMQYYAARFTAHEPDCLREVMLFNVTSGGGGDDPQLCDN
ncbi:hypothetical protein RRG08_065259 [Elysia crispata]|uniref:Uncharacterized protein n=1 Tax=Elysia crispata TaxID=231223 RepID=A0AAE0ZTT0_9GAST|nr:hypothetical protein RRG08_065259 [Elysia crispata]